MTLTMTCKDFAEIYYQDKAMELIKLENYRLLYNYTVIYEKTHTGHYFRLTVVPIYGEKYLKQACSFQYMHADHKHGKGQQNYVH